MRYLEDFTIGEVFHFHTAPLTKAQIMEFAHDWDPQRIHIDETFAEKMHGGLIASGFHTLLIVFEPAVRGLMAHTANIGGIGLDRLRWHRPLRPEEALDVRFEVLSATPSRSKPDRGVSVYAVEARNPAGELIMSVEILIMVQRRQENQK